MKRFNFIILILIINTLLLLYYGKPVIESDGLTYYIIARSFAEDGDFNISEKNYYPDRRFFHYILNKEKNRIGVTFSGGYAILVSPFIRLTRFIGSFCPYINNLSPYYEWPPFIDCIAILLANFFYLNLMFIILYRFLISIFSPLTAFCSIYTAFLGTPLIYYTFTAPAFSQFADTFAFAMFFVSSMMYFQNRAKGSGMMYLFLSGLCLGLSVFIRNNNFVFFIPYAVFILLYSIKEKISIKGILLRYLVLSASAVPFAVLLLIYNLVQYGDPFVTGYSLHGNFIFRSTLLYQLFHPVRGLFIYTPLAAVVIGGLLFAKRHKLQRMLSIWYVIAFFALCQFFHYWRGGISYGHRFSVHLYPVYAFALALIFSAGLKGYRKVLVYALILIFTAYAFAHYNLYVYASATQNSRNYLFRNNDKYDIIDIARSANIALDDVKKWRKTGTRGGLYYLNLYHYAPSLLFLPINNIHRNFLTFLKGISISEKGENLSVDITLRSFDGGIWHPRIFICQFDKRGHYLDQRLILLSTPSCGIKFEKGINILRYSISPEMKFSIFLNEKMIQDEKEMEKADNWIERLNNEEKIAIVLYYASAEIRDGKPKVNKYYRNSEVFDAALFRGLIAENGYPLDQIQN